MRITRLLSAAAGIILLLLVGLPVALWVGFPALAPVLAAPVLNARGIALIQLQTTRPGRHGITVRTLELTQAANGLSLRGDDLQLAWELSLSALPKEFTSVRIGRLDLAYEPPSAAPGTAIEPSALTMPAALLAGLPTRSLEIKALTASGRIAEQAFEAAGTLRASPSDACFAGRIEADALPAPVAIRAQLHPDDRISVRVDTAAEDGAFLTVDGALSATPAGPAFAGVTKLDLDRIQSWLDAPDPWPTGMLDLQLAVTLDPTPALTLKPASRGRMQLRDGESAVTVALELAEALELTFADDTLIFSTGTLPLQIEAQRGASSMVGDFVFAGVEMSGRSGAVARVQGTGLASWPSGSGDFAIQLPLQAMTAPLRLDIPANAELVVENLAYRQATLAHVRVRNTAPLKLSADGLLNDAELSLVVDDPAQLDLAAQLRVSPAGDIAAEFEETSLPLADNALLAMVLPATVALRSGRVHAEGQILRSSAGVISAALETRWQNAGVDLTTARIRGASGAASLDYRDGMLAIASATATVERLEWISADGPQATILLRELQGSGSGTLGIRIDPELQSGFELGQVAMSTALSAQRIARGDIAAEAVELDARISGKPLLPNIAGQLRMASAAVGVPVQDVICEFDTDDFEVWQLKDCSAAALGGAVHLPRGDFDLATGSGYLPLAVTGVHLSAVLGLMQDPALDGSGILDGSLPLRLKAMNPMVEQGWLAVRPPGGVLSYVAAAHVLAGIEQPALRLTMRAVRDLRYQRLESRVDYTEDGILTLAVNLLGSNPEIEGGRPIQLNLNVTQNLLTLLQSLRLSDNIEQQLQRRMQRVQP
ncbi:MAG: YdbH domain-containing protein [Gammaproteobacteria bacterium]|nr:YdbH domain-containing protein [Gammaproteobacteria bacterium]